MGNTLSQKDQTSPSTCVPQQLASKVIFNTTHLVEVDKRPVCVGMHDHRESKLAALEDLLDLLPAAVEVRLCISEMHNAHNSTDVYLPNLCFQLYSEHTHNTCIDTHTHTHLLSNRYPAHSKNFWLFCSDFVSHHW